MAIVWKREELRENLELEDDTKKSGSYAKTQRHNYLVIEHDLMPLDTLLKIFTAQMTY